MFAQSDTVCWKDSRFLHVSFLERSCCFSDPINIYEENWEISNNKTKASIQLESSSKTSRGAFEPSEGAVESETKASTDIESPSKRKRSGNDDSDLSLSSSDLSPSNPENLSTLLIGNTSRGKLMVWKRLKVCMKVIRSVLDSYIGPWKKKISLSTETRQFKHTEVTVRGSDLIHKYF